MEAIAQGFQRLLKDYKETSHGDLEEIFDVKVTIFDHVDTILKYMPIAHEIMLKRFPHLQLDDKFLLDVAEWQNEIRSAVILHDIVELEAEFDEPEIEEEPEETEEDEMDGEEKEEEEENDEETKVEPTEDKKERLYFDYLAEYFGEKFKDSISKNVIKMIKNHDLHAESKADMEEFISKNSKKEVLKQVYFLIVHNFGTLALLKEFQTKATIKVNDEDEIFNPDLGNIAVNLQMANLFNLLDNSLFKKAEKDNKEFTAQVIALNNVSNNEANTSETVTSGDVGGGAHGEGDARHSNIFKNPFRRAWMIYNGRQRDNNLERKSEDIMKKKAGSRKSYIVNPQTLTGVVG